MEIIFKATPKGISFYEYSGSKHEKWDSKKIIPKKCWVSTSIEIFSLVMKHVQNMNVPVAVNKINETLKKDDKMFHLDSIRVESGKEYLWRIKLKTINNLQ